MSLRNTDFRLFRRTPLTPSKQMTGPDPPLWNIEFCTHFYIPPPEGYIFNIFDIFDIYIRLFVANVFVKVSIYRKLASRNYNLAGYKLFMSIYNLQTRTGLNNSFVILNLNTISHLL